MLQLTRPSASSLNLLKNLEDLDRGIINHTHWLKDLHRSLICEDEQPSANDVKTDAHCHCNFGLWFYNSEHQELDQLELFQQIGHQHQAMHALARQILLKRKTETFVSSVDYNTFIESVIDFKLAIRRLQNTIIEEVCVIDHLTGCFNRQSMATKLSQEHERVTRKGGCCALVMIDVDHFKQVNDTYGHAVGDEVLRGIAERFSAQLRSYDYLFRYGGEEFLVCLPDSDGKSAEQLMERLRLDLAESPLMLGDGTELCITASFGVSHLTPNKNIEDTMLEADHALLFAKSSGRNRVHLWNTD